MKRFNTDTSCEEEIPKVDEFIEAVLSLCKKFDLSIGHEDSYGAFEVFGRYNEDTASRLRSANYAPAPSEEILPKEICPNCGGLAIREGVQRRCDFCRLYT